MLPICALFRASSAIGSSAGLIIMAHKNHYLFFVLSNCTYNSNILKNENFLAYLMRILNSCVISTSRVRVDYTHRDAGRWRHGKGIHPSVLSKGEQRGRRCLFIIGLGAGKFLV